ncbi:MAG: restriction endonuclease [Anaerolineaceae bacterium]|nr:restriction endonuclease [Anaerolineaceae bacterium]
MTNQWREFEQLAERIMAELQPHAQVKWNDFIYGYDTEKDRQIDVSIRASYEGKEVLTIVQARNRNTPADINSVGEFASVVKDVRAQKGILVCRSGFTEAAKTYARNIGIELLNLHDAESRDWNLDIRLPILWIEEAPEGSILVDFQVDKKINIPFSHERTPILSLDQNGKQLIDLWQTLKNLWDSKKLDRTPGRLHTHNFQTQLYMMGMGLDKSQTEQWFPINNLRINYIVQRQVYLGFLNPAECRGIWSYLNNSFSVSYLPLGEIPKKPDTEWLKIENPGVLSVTANATIVVTRELILGFGTSSVELDNSVIWKE